MNADIRSDRNLIRTAGGSRRYALVKLTVPPAPSSMERAPANISFVLDRSGSMHGDRKFELVREAVDRALGLLREGDRFSVVVYDDQIELLMESTPRHGGSQAGGARTARTDLPPGLDQPGERVAARVRTSRLFLQRRRPGQVPPHDRRPGQRGDHRRG